ncbi:MAG: thiamine pyrophosphate-dependent dehydrogenase E1 component subunit alpha [Chloroflexi bacterium]|nr:thiamine pyrophosphate-dependent dehydrogenase E1 component subunit alpha [Chloroflexota bacterium]
MVLIRRVEEAVGRLYARGLAPGTTHLSIGQEACAVGATAALRPDDSVFSTHRGHGHFLAKGADPNRLMAELLGRAAGYCRGFGGSQHMSYPAIGFIGTNGITGGNLPVATGAALAARRLGTDRVVLVFFGDGACNQGTFHESLNMAGLWQLPIVYFLENNLYAQWTHVRRSTAVAELASRASGYGLPGIVVDGMDPLAVQAGTQDAVERARRGHGPTLIEARTYRLTGHSKGDVKTALYRPADEENAWQSRDPIPAFRRRLLESGAATEEVLTSLEGQAERQVDEAVAFALAAPAADPTEALEGVYAAHRTPA